MQKVLQPETSEGGVTRERPPPPGPTSPTSASLPTSAAFLPCSGGVAAVGPCELPSHHVEVARWD
jgi:hypothetical protein